MGRGVRKKVRDKMLESLLQSKIRINTQGFKVKVKEGRQTGRERSISCVFWSFSFSCGLVSVSSSLFTPEGLVVKPCVDGSIL